MNEAEIINALKKKFPENQYALLPQVRNGTGFERSARTADAMLMSLWPSRGLDLEGIEIKVSRGDWLREMKAPQKAEDIYAYCDRWWLVVSDAAIVKEGELPSTWGLMVMGEKGLRVKVAAPKLGAKPLDRLMLAAILRKAQGYSTDNVVLDQEKKASFEQGYKSGCKTAEHVEERRKQLEEVIRVFEDASGVNIRHEWDLGGIGKAVKMVRHGALSKGREQLKQLAESAKRLATDAERELALIDSVCPASNQPVSVTVQEVASDARTTDIGCGSSSPQ